MTTKESLFEYNGIYFYEGTPLNLCNKLIELMNSKKRVVFDYGNTQTKVSWGEVYDVTGRIGKTTGIKPMLILVYNNRSSGGGIISTNRVLSIKSSLGKEVIYSV